MQLLKIYDFKGLWQNGKKMAIPTGFFRRFTNAYKDRTGRIVPFGKGEAKSTNIPTNITSERYPEVSWLGPVASAPFLGGVVQMFPSAIAGTSRWFQFRYSNTDNVANDIMQPYSDSIGSYTEDVSVFFWQETKDSGLFNNTTVLNKAYFNLDHDISKYFGENTYEASPTNVGILAFDGLRFRGAGLPTPHNAIDQSGTPGAHYVRSFLCTIGMDAEVILSPMLEQRVAAANSTLYLGVYSSLVLTPEKRPDAIGTAGTIPSARKKDDTIFNLTKRWDTRFAQITTGLTVTGGTLTATLGTYSTGLKAGDWLMIYFGYDTLYTGLSGNTMMFQVASIGAQITFEDKFKILNASNVTWETVASMNDIWTGMSGAEQTSFTNISQNYGALSNIFALYTYSTTATGAYQLANEGIRPFCYGSTLTYIPTSLANPRLDRYPFLGVITRYLTDWFDVTSEKSLFPPVYGITNYKELLVGHDRNAIYFSDTTLGGSTEMVSMVSNFAPSGTEFGQLTAVCGSEDFLFFSRERKNYILRGDLATGGFSITECDQAIAGAYNSRCCANVWGGRVVFMNRDGIWAVDANANVTELSEPIRDLFIGNSPDGNLFDNSVFRSAAQLRETTGTPPGPYKLQQDGSIFKIALDADRGFILFLTYRSETIRDETLPEPVYEEVTVPSNLLVYDTNDGSWYEFEGNGATSVESYLSKVFSLGTSFYSEDGIMQGAERQTIITQWSSAGEPSLEKQVTQVKLFGDFLRDAANKYGCEIGQQNDWKRYAGTPVLNTDTTYEAVDSAQYAHKKRLNSSKPQVTSIIVKSTLGGGFRLEGMEIEGDLVQEGTKK